MEPLPKQVLRDELLAARRRLTPDERATRSDLVAERVTGLDAFERARVVALYAPMGAEVDTAAIARAAARMGKRVAYPRIAEGRRPLEFAEAPGDLFVAGGYRSREPPPQAPAIPMSAIDLVVVPGLGFDASCRRLGRGRGHYDATLALLPSTAMRVGVAFDVQIVPEIPQEAHDAPLDVVVTESRMFVRSPKT